MGVDRGEPGTHCEWFALEARTRRCLPRCFRRCLGRYLRGGSRRLRRVRRPLRLRPLHRPLPAQIEQAPQRLPRNLHQALLRRAPHDAHWRQPVHIPAPHQPGNFCRPLCVLTDAPHKRDGLDGRLRLDKQQAVHIHFDRRHPVVVAAIPATSSSGVGRFRRQRSDLLLNRRLDILFSFVLSTGGCVGVMHRFDTVHLFRILTPQNVIVSATVHNKHSSMVQDRKPHNHNNTQQPPNNHTTLNNQHNYPTTTPHTTTPQNTPNTSRRQIGTHKKRNKRRGKIIKRTSAKRTPTSLAAFPSWCRAHVTQIPVSPGWIIPSPLATRESLDCWWGVFHLPAFPVYSRHNRLA